MGLTAVRRWTAALVATTAIWGSTFVVVEEAVERLPVFAFNTWRFALAALLLGWVARRDLRRLGRRGLVHGVLLGAALWAGYALQTAGLTLTTAAKAGFITGTFVVFTPLLQALVLRRAPSRAAVGATLWALVGLGLLTLDGTLVPSAGDLLVLGCALAFALHIVGLGAWSARYPAAALAAVQLGTSAVLHATGGAVEAVVSVDPYRWVTGDGYVWLAVGFTAVFASALAFTVQTAAQAVIPPVRAAVILTMEPVFAWVTAAVLVPLAVALGATGLEPEQFGWREGLGAVVVLTAMLWSELRAQTPADAVAAPDTGVVLSGPVRER